jgi:hypothetical protein
MITRRFLAAVFFVHAAVSVPASAAPAPMAPLSAVASKDLDAFVARGRATSPESFRSLVKLRDEVPVLARKARGGKMNVRALLVAQGRTALPAVLAELRDGPEATPGSWLAPSASSWIVGLIETAGHWGDPVAVPVLEALAMHPQAHVDIAAAAVRALGAIGTDDAEKRLEAVFAAQHDKRVAIAPALGDCRRIAMARFLVRGLEGANVDEQLALVKALGQVGSAWPWQTPSLVKRGEGNDVRRLVFDTLLLRYGQATDAQRSGLVDALWLVDWPEGPARARAEGAKNASATQAYEALALKLAKSPLHR